MYVGRVWLHYTDEQIWALTPRQFDTQIKVHEDITKRMHGAEPSAAAQPTGFIDQIPGW